MSGHGFVPSPFFAFRTPVLPFERFEELAAGAGAPAAVGDPILLEEAVARDRADQRRRLRALVARPEVREALFLASPDLDDALPTWLREPDSKKGQRVERSLVRYVARMTARATPFGLFAASAVGRLGTETRLVVESWDSGHRRSRLDMDYLLALTDALGRDPSVRPILEYRVNSSLYRIGDRVRYVETRIDGRERTCHLVAVEDSPHLGRVQAGARTGATLDELAALVADDEVSLAEAREFVGELADAQVLVPDLPLRLTSLDPVADLIGVLGRHAPTRGVASSLGAVAAELAAIDAAGSGVEPAVYRRLAARLAGLPARPELSRLVQVDLVKPAPHARLGARVLAEVHRGLDLLHRMMPPKGFRLGEFREAFEERYGLREVPLVEALDEEAGIGYPAWTGEDSLTAPLLAGVRFPDAEAGTARWGPREEHLLRLLSSALSAGSDEIVLSDRDVDALSVRDRAPLPGALTAAVRLAAPSVEALDRGDFRLSFEAASGPSGAHYLGRFCHADPELRRAVDEHLKAEEALDPEAVFAEIVHLPEGRMGNIVTRPPFRGFEIPFLGDSGAEAGRQIPITDLTIRVQGEEVVLRSSRLGRRVLPRLTTAHNYFAHGFGLYRFLCVLQQERTSGGVVWDWGPLASAPFLPRVVVGRIVLSAARWQIGRDELAALAGSGGARRFALVAAWRARRRIPRFAYLVESEAELLVDFDSVLSVDAWLHLVEGGDAVELKEMFPPAGELCARGVEGRFVHQLLVPFVRERLPRPSVDGSGSAEGPAATGEPLPGPSPAAVRRSFPPGSEWLGAKLYGGAPTLERLLRDRLGEEARALVAAGVADRWFFVRYFDPRPHLRIRLRGDPDRLRDEAWPRLGAASEELLDRGLVWKVQLDTYEREIERYGGAAAIELAEELFHLDSDAVLEVLGMLEDGDEGEEERWRLALLGADRLLDDLGLSFEAKLALVEGVRLGYGREHREDTALRRSLAETGRTRDRELASLLGSQAGIPPSLAPGVEVFARRASGVRDVARRIHDLERQGRLAVSRASLATSFVHMFLNRLLVSSHRRQELVVYDALLRTYRSARARLYNAGEGFAS